MDPIKPINLPFLQEPPCGEGFLNEVSCRVDSPPMPADSFKPTNFQTLAGCQNTPLVLALTPKPIDKVEELVTRFRKSAQSPNTLVQASGWLKLEELLLNELRRPGFCNDQHLYSKPALLEARTETEARMQRATGGDRKLYAHALSVLNVAIRERKD